MREAFLGLLNHIVVTKHMREKRLLPEQLLTFGRHWAETVGGLWLIDNVVPLRPDKEKVRLRQGFRHLIEECQHLYEKRFLPSGKGAIARRSSEASLKSSILEPRISF